jgi:DNA-binding response OmpR family regulator
VIIIDNERDILDLMEVILTDAGCDVITATDSTVLYNIEANPPALILLDNWLGNKSGQEICRELKSMPKTAHIPVLLVSGASNIHEVVAICKAAGYIPKPFDLEELVRKVQEFI